MFNKVGKNTIEDTQKFEIAKKELSKALNIAIGKRSISEFANECKMVDPKLIIDILNEKINVLPSRMLFRDIEKASERRITYSHLCQICGYSEYDCNDDSWKSYYVNRGSVYMIDLGYSNLDSEQNGIRPCLIVSNNKGNEKSSILTVIPLTTKEKRPMPTHVSLTIKDGMRRNSIVCPEQITTVTKRRLFYNRVPIKVLDLSEEKIFEINVALEKQLGLIDCFFNDDIAFELVEHIKELRKNIEVKKSRSLVGVLDRKIDDLVTYCRKYNRSIDRVINEYEMSENYICAM
jgi:mRNA interferase MazF